MMSKSQPQAIKDILSTVLEGVKGKEPQQPGVGLLREWRRVLRSKIARHSKPIARKGGCLIVNVDSSSYLYELNLQKEEILNRLKKRLGEEKIDEIQFRIGET